MIKFSYIDKQILARLDAEGTDAYEISLDRIPAINGAQHLLESVMTSLFEGKKFSAEALRDLHHVVVFQTNAYGQIALDTHLNEIDVRFPAWMGNAKQKLWSVVAVFPEFVAADTADVQPDPLATRSKLRTDVRFISPTYSAVRYTHEEWERIKNDPFAPGNSVLTGSLKTYGYTFGTKAVAGGLSFLPLTVMPHTNGTRRLVAISYLKVPHVVPDMVDEDDPLYEQVELEWPDSMAELIISIALRFIAFKQGDQTNLNSLTTQEMSMLVNANA